MSHRNHVVNLHSLMEATGTEAQLPPSFPVESQFSVEYTPSFYSNRFSEYMSPIFVEEKQNSKNRTVVYNFHPNINLDVLYGVKLKGRIPSLTVHPDYQHEIRIAWCSYVAHYIVPSIDMDVDGAGALGSLTSHLMTVLSQKHVAEHVTSIYDRYTGNVPELTEFHQDLPAFEFEYTIPFSFCFDRRLAIPLFLHKNQMVRFIAEFESTPMNILRMQQLNQEGKWEPIPYDPAYLKEEAHIPVPRLEGEYAMLMADEKKMRKDRILQKNQEYRIKLIDFVLDESTDDCKLFDQRVTRELQDVLPTQTIYWMVQKYTDHYYNHRTRFTNDTDHIRESRILLNNRVPYRTLDRKDMDLLEMAYTQGHSRVPGIWFYPFGVRLNPFGTKPCLPFQNDSSSAHLKKMGASLEIVTEDSEFAERQKESRLHGIKLDMTPPVYFLYIYLQHQKQLVYDHESGVIKIRVVDTPGRDIREILQTS